MAQMFQRSDLHFIHISPDKLMKGAISQMKMKKNIRKRQCNFFFSGWSYVDLPFAINTGSPKLISHQPLVFHLFFFSCLLNIARKCRQALMYPFKVPLVSVIRLRRLSPTPAMNLSMSLLKLKTGMFDLIVSSFHSVSEHFYF